MPSGQVVAYQHSQTAPYSRFFFDTYVVLDCETSGLSPTSNEIIEVALIKYVNGELVDTFSSLVAPSNPIFLLFFG